MSDEIIRFYLDTPIILDYLERRTRHNQNSNYLIDHLFSNSYWHGYVSFFGVMEIIDKEQELRQMRELMIENKTIQEILNESRTKQLGSEKREIEYDEVIEFFSRNRKKIDIIDLKEDSCQHAKELLKNMDISAPDAIHLQTAVVISNLSRSKIIFASCDEALVTTITQNYQPESLIIPLLCKKGIIHAKFEEQLHKAIEICHQTHTASVPKTEDTEMLTTAAEEIYSRSKESDLKLPISLSKNLIRYWLKEVSKNTNQKEHKK